jgi:hypothetical protein
MAKLDKRDIPGIAAIVGFFAVLLTIIWVGVSNVVVGLIVAFVATIVAILVAWRFEPARIIWIPVAFCFTIGASVVFNQGYPTQWLTLVASLVSATIGFAVIVFGDHPDADGFPIIPFAFAGSTSFFTILISLSAFVPQESIEQLDDSILPAVGGLLGLWFVVILGRGIYSAVRDRWGQDGKREGIVYEGDHSSAQNEDDAIKKLARLLSGINREILKPLFLVIFVCAIIYIPVYLLSLINIP